MNERLQKLGYKVITNENENDITFILIKNVDVMASFIMDKDDHMIWHIDYRGSYQQLLNLLEELEK